MSKIIWTKPAVKSLDGIYEHIARDSEYYASNFINNIIESAENASEMPGVGRKVPEVNDKNIREVFLNPYRIMYRIKKDHIEVLNVIHGHRFVSRDDIISRA